MNLYLLSRIGKVSYVEVHSFVVAALDEPLARAACRVKCGNECAHGRSGAPSDGPCIWADASRATCTLIGVAAPGVAGVAIAAIGA